ncbi:protein JASON [Sesamum alatum]|uniref:Protein JASON n=1 Tax=Sesamum alatum TaxID=300844 RepID=A0AAE1YXE2_9LAMI|nr:protein JASON [Sesamum alatum]
MGCFFGCFRVKDSHSNLINSPEPVVSRSKNALSSLFQCDDESPRKGEEGGNPLPKELGIRELKDEAKFLKACGTLPETPIEIRKASEKWQDIPARIGEEKSSKFVSWLPNASMEKLKLEKQPDESPRPVKVHGEQLTGLGSLMDSPSSCLTDGHSMGKVSSSSIQRKDIQHVFTPLDARGSETHSETSSISPGLFPPSVQCKNKSVRFDCESDRSAFSSKGSSSEGASQHSKQFGLVGSGSVTKPSPYPVLDPVENPSQWNELKDENSDSQHLRESLKQNHEINLMSTPTSKLAVEHLSAGEEMKNEESLSSWLKPPSAKQDGKNKQFGYLRRTPADRPILGMVAAHWNDHEESHISPKWWDGNGIPNSTNKYKEDQKVSWHATPFEERLEKALSEETFISQRKPISKTPPVDFSESEESDTALSHLQSSAHLKSVVSF